MAIAWVKPVVTTKKMWPIIYVLSKWLCDMIANAGS